MGQQNVFIFKNMVISHFMYSFIKLGGDYGCFMVIKTGIKGHFTFISTLVLC